MEPWCLLCIEHFVWPSCLRRVIGKEEDHGCCKFLFSHKNFVSFLVYLIYWDITLFTNWRNSKTLSWNFAGVTNYSVHVCWPNLLITVKPSVIPVLGVNNDSCSTSKVLLRLCFCNSLSFFLHPFMRRDGLAKFFLNMFYRFLTTMCVTITEFFHRIH